MRISESTFVGTRAPRLALALAALVLAILAVGVSSASAAKVPGQVCGSGGAKGGELGGARGIAVNETGAGDVAVGTIYVNEFGNNRVHSLDADCNFIRAWGWDVIADGEPNDTGAEFEICEVAEECKAGAPGTGDGQFASASLAGGIAVNQSTGDVYTIDRANNRVQQFTATGAFVRAWGTAGGGTGTGAGEFGFGSTVRLPGIGIDSSGDVYVADPGNARVQKFDSEGNFLRMGGWDVDSDNPSTEYEICTVSDDCKAGSTGTGMFQFGTSLPGYMDVSPAGDVYPVSKADGTIYWLDSDLTPVDELESTTGGGTNPSRNPIAVNPADGHIFFAQAIVLGGSGRATDEIFEVDPATDTEVAKHPVGQNEWVALAVDGGTGRMYGTRTTNATSVQIFEEQGPWSPETLPPDPVTWTTATLRGEIDPVGEPLDECFFEWGPTTAYGNVMPCDQTPGEIGDGTGPVPVSAQVGGLAPNGATFHYRLVATAPRSNGNNVSFQTPDAVVTKPASAIAGTTATLNGEVNPVGNEVTECAFEYGPTTAYGSEAPCAETPAQIGTGSDPVPVHADVSGLQPGETHHFRLKASNALDGTVNGASQSFQTKGPVIKDVFVPAIGYTDATLAAVINPQDAATTYRFEYGTDGPCSNPANDCTSVPVPDAAVGADSSDHSVSEELTELEAGTTYHFRLVASNVSAVNQGPDLTFDTYAFVEVDRDCPNDAIRAAQGSLHLPDCRAYEMVSPVDKNQGGIDMSFAGVAWDGEAAAFVASALFGEPPAQQPVGNAPYLSRRTAQGWVTSSPFPRYCMLDTDSPISNIAQRALLSRNFERAFILKPEFSACAIPSIDPAAPMPSKNAYRQDYTTDPFGLALLAPNPGPPSSDPSSMPSAHYLGGSEDFSRIVYGSDTNQTAPPDSPAEGDFAKLYEWRQPGEGGCADPGGCRRLVSVDTDGVPFATNSGKPQRLNTLDSWTQPTFVSAGGERIYFQNRVGSSLGISGVQQCNNVDCRLYMRESGSTTFHVSESECTVDCGSHSSAARFLWTNPPGDVAVFWSCDKLTDQSSPTSGNSCANDTSVGANDVAKGAKLYRWDRNAPQGSRLTDISLDNEPADGGQPGALNIIGASDNGETFFFIAGGQIVAGEPVHGLLKIYRWRHNDGDPEVDYLGPYVSMHGGMSTSVTSVLQRDPTVHGGYRNVTPDGDYVVVITPHPIDPAADGDTDVDIYRWGEEEGWECVSCQPPLMPSLGHADFFDPARLMGAQSFNGVLHAEWPSPRISDDGQRVSFSTPNPLVAEDVNHRDGCPEQPPGFFGGVHYGCDDIYVWQDGEARLISDGIFSTGGVVGNIMVGASSDGDSIFFKTRERLSGWDQDNGLDLYVARVEGGFPEPLPREAPCEGEACRGAGTSSPDTPGAGSAVFAGPGNPGPDRCGGFAAAARKQARAARRLGVRARKMRQAARRAAPRRAGALRAKARRAALAARKRQAAAKRLRARAKRCRQAGSNRGAVR